MTVIAVRDGIMAVDSLTIVDGGRSGEVRKWAVVRPERGGGFVAGSGDTGAVTIAVEAVAEAGAEGEVPKAAHLMWLRADRSVWLNDEGAGWFAVDAPYHGGGSGGEVARAAMFMGARAETAVRVACELSIWCGGKVHVLQLGLDD